jgi:hypothetical protein
MQPLKAYSNAPLTLIDIGATRRDSPTMAKVDEPLSCANFRDLNPMKQNAPLLNAKCAKPSSSICRSLSARKVVAKNLSSLGRRRKQFTVPTKLHVHQPIYSQNAITPSNAKFQFKLTRSMPFLNSQALTMWII